jgi:hypothetical protein
MDVKREVELMRGTPKAPRVLRLASVAVCTLLAACGNLSDQLLPAGTADPGMVENAVGARGMAADARLEFQLGLTYDINAAGLLTDEMPAASRGAKEVLGSISDGDIAMDSRQLPEQSTIQSGNAGNAYLHLHYARTRAQEAIGALLTYAPDSSTRLRGALYAWEGYAEVMLADLFCSGVPLSYVTYQHDFTYAPSSTTAQVYEHAITLFDSALTLASDSAPISGLASVGKGRALLDLGRYADAAQAVANVPSDFGYADSIMVCLYGTCPSVVANTRASLAIVAGVSDVEGIHGRPFISGHDPRTAVLSNPVTTTPYGFQVWWPAKYTRNAVNPIVVASGIEAQLIRAEAALQAGDTDGWLATLNALRSQNAITSGMPAIVDPGTFDMRVDTLFAERAAWLFLTGTRQGDLRRLVNLYHRSSQTTYPSGAYPGIGTYGNNIDIPIPPQELDNPYFKGCLRRD